MRVLTQFHSSQEHEQFLSGIRRQRELEVRINELMRYRRHGITTVEECHHFEQLRQEARDKRRNSVSNEIITFFKFFLRVYSFQLINYYNIYS